MYSACQVRKMTVDNLGPTASGIFSKNDVCSFDYSTSVGLIKTETGKAFQFLYCLLYCQSPKLRSRYYCELQI